jgi:hypothetical protein
MSLTKRYQSEAEKRRRADAQRRAGAKSTAENHKRKPTVIDWDAAIKRARAILDEHQHLDEQKQ